MAIEDYIQERVSRSIYHAIRKKVVSMGYLPDIDNFPDTEEGDKEFLAAKEQIKVEKGFYIDVFNHSSARAKYHKECPRIVIIFSRVFEGDIGAPPEQMWQLDATTSEYKSGLVPSQSSHLIFAIHILSNRTKQDAILTRILSNVVGGQRGYLQFYDDLDHRFFMVHSSYNDMSDPIENIIEKAYFYTVTDIWMADTQDTGRTLKPINEIKVDIEIGDSETKDNLTITN